jgi:hypothetical protein
MKPEGQTPQFARRPHRPPTAGAPLFGETAAKRPPRRAAEPTIHTEYPPNRHVGTRDAAVQAQATRFIRQ